MYEFHNKCYKTDKTSESIRLRQIPLKEKASENEGPRPPFAPYSFLPSLRGIEIKGEEKRRIKETRRPNGRTEASKAGGGFTKIGRRRL